MDEAFEAAYVAPFYLRMMGGNARNAGAELLADVRASARRVTPEEVRDLLRRDWRPRVMGARYALAHPADEVGEELSRSMRTSWGTLTAPPLATVATLVLGADALPALEEYASTSAADANLGSDGFVAAAIEVLGGTPAHAVPTPEDRGLLARMLDVAVTVRGG